MRVYPVSHHHDNNTSLEQAAIAFAAGSDGVFLISHTGKDNELIPLAAWLKVNYGPGRIGVNLLNSTIAAANIIARRNGIDLLWVDDAGINSAGVAPITEWLVSQRAERGGPQIFASVAFKYQPNEPDPPRAAATAARLGMIPTTSGVATGVAPTIAKIAAMRAACGDRLAVANGMTVDNVGEYLPYVTDFLVASDVSRDFNHFDPIRLKVFVDRVKRARPAA